MVLPHLPLSFLHALLGSSPPRTPATLPGLPLLCMPSLAVHRAAPSHPEPCARAHALAAPSSPCRGTGTLRAPPCPARTRTRSQPPPLPGPVHALRVPRTPAAPLAAARRVPSPASPRRPPSALPEQRRCVATRASGRSAINGAPRCSLAGHRPRTSPSPLAAAGPAPSHPCLGARARRRAGLAAHAVPHCH